MLALGDVDGAGERFRRLSSQRAFAATQHDVGFEITAALIARQKGELAAAESAAHRALVSATDNLVVRGTATSRSRPTLVWESITQTEPKVIDLARHGNTNALIAKELLMGTETVKTHLSRV